MGHGAGPEPSTGDPAFRYDDSVNICFGDGGLR